MTRGSVFFRLGESAFGTTGPASSDMILFLFPRGASAPRLFAAERQQGDGRGVAGMLVIRDIFRQPHQHVDAAHHLRLVCAPVPGDGALDFLGLEFHYRRQAQGLTDRAHQVLPSPLRHANFDAAPRPWSLSRNKFHAMPSGQVINYTLETCQSGGGRDSHCFQRQWQLALVIGQRHDTAVVAQVYPKNANRSLLSAVPLYPVCIAAAKLCCAVRF